MTNFSDFVGDQIEVRGSRVSGFRSGFYMQHLCQKVHKKVERRPTVSPRSNYWPVLWMIMYIL